MSEEQVSSPTFSKEPAKGMPKKTFLLIAILALAAIGLVAFALSPKTKTPPKETTTTQKVVPAQTTLKISSTLVRESTASANYLSDITINTGQNKVTAVQLELSYNPNVLGSVDILPGTFFDNPNILLKKVDQQNGRITFALAVPLGQKGITGQGVLAKLSFRLVGSDKSTTVDFLPKTDVSDEESPESVLKSSVGGLFNLEGLVSSPSQPIGTSSAN